MYHIPRARALPRSAVAALILLAAGCGGRDPAPASPPADSSRPATATVNAEAATALLEKWCAQCHLPPSAASHPARKWGYIVLRMQAHRIAGGLAEIDKSELETLVGYLESHAQPYFIPSWLGAVVDGGITECMRQFGARLCAASLGRRADQRRNAAAAGGTGHERNPGDRLARPQQTGVRSDGVVCHQQYRTLAAGDPRRSRRRLSARHTRRRSRHGRIVRAHRTRQSRRHFAFSAERAEGSAIDAARLAAAPSRRNATSAEIQPRPCKRRCNSALSSQWRKNNIFSPPRLSAHCGQVR